MKHFVKHVSAALAALALVSCSSPLVPVPGNAEQSAARAISAGFSGEVTIKAGANAQFVCADLDAASQLVANRGSAQGWETFSLEPKGNNEFALKAKANGKYVSADLDKGAFLSASRDSAQGWETFSLVALGGDNYALKAKANGKFVAADLDKGGRLVADRASAQGWESFTILPLGGGGGGGGSANLSVAYVAPAGGDFWGNGYNARFTISNQGASDAVASGATPAWTLSMNLAANPGSSPWAGTSFSWANGVLTLSPVAGGALATIPPGKSISVGFTVLNSTAQPSNIQVNGGGDQVPAAPGGVAASAGNGSAQISWSPVSGASSYAVYRSQTPGAGTAGTKLANVSSPLNVAGLSNGTTYYFVVTAANAQGESPASAQVSATPNAAWTWPTPSGKFYCGKQISGTMVNESVYNGWNPTPWASFPYLGQANQMIANNIWGMDPKYNNGTGTSVVFQEMVNGVPVYGWAWDLKANAVPNEPWAHVINYPQIGWGWSPNSGQWWNGPVDMPKINSGKKILVDFNIKRQMDPNGAWNNAFDIWIYPQAHPGPGSGNPANPGGYELMIWLDHEVQGPWGSNPQTATINGASWSATSNDGSAGWKVLTYINQGAPINDVRGWNISAFIQDAVQRYGVSPECYVNAIEFGAESCGASTIGPYHKGMMEIANYKLTIQ